jgi:uncharacterized membrane protein
MASNNPYQAPSAPVSDYVAETDEGGRLDEPRTCSAGDGAQWIGYGWQAFTAAPGLWIGITVVWFIFAFTMNLIPILSIIASALLTPMFMAGLFVGLDEQRRGGPLTFAHLFEGFNRNSGSLAIVGLLYLVGTFAAVIVAMVPMLATGSFGALLDGPDASMLPSVLLFVLIAFALILPVIMAWWFAPALVALEGMPALDAMKLSFVACLRNILPFLVYGILMFLIAIAATLPLLLGWLIAFPLFMGSWYASYRDIFFER